ncbi:unnamed protein product [Periconia digitata]|uniref:NAD(P)-binding domain-containing protein n=1 Tax=Periconia digitata TaxID=1303443 RepID=A0A9W4U4R6_9PLEO|nr:unnamed protein product [Periconia digitata]
MHILLTGATGHIGHAILQTLLSHPSTTHITTLTRRPFTPPTPTPKHTNIVLTTFSTWPEEVLSQIKDADAMIWAMGASNADEAVNYEYPVAFQDSFLAALNNNNNTSKKDNKRFRFLYLSGALAESAQDTSLYFLAAARKVKGRTETFSLEFAERNSRFWRTWVLKPGGVYKEGSWGEYASWGLPKKLGSVGCEELAAFAVDVAVKGGEEEGRVLNERIVGRGREVLGR